ncbi:MAG TPA: ABC transporter permease [Symbiobacteriaceae bacterium]|nr:ABC transporter permease [Symbiobacteriaceae bacterium]
MATLQAQPSTARKSGEITTTLRKVAKNYYLRRTLKAIASIFVVTTLTFFLIRLMPGNPLDIYINSQMVALGISREEAETMAAAIFQIDLDRPIFLQYGDYLWGLLHGDFGLSIVSTRTPVSALILRFLPWTLFVVSVALVASFTIGVLIGTIMAYKRNTWVDYLFTSFSSIMSAIPDFMVGTLIIVYCGVRWKWFSVTGVRGSLSPGMQPGWDIKFFLDAFYHAALPIVTLVICNVGPWMLQMRSSTMATLGEDYVMVAKARGLTEGRITAGYVGRNALLPLFTTLAISIGGMFGGSVLIESVFTYNGIGIKLASALGSRDYPVMQAVFIIITTATVSANLFADFLYGWLDPRIRTEGR